MAEAKAHLSEEIRLCDPGRVPRYLLKLDRSLTNAFVDVATLDDKSFSQKAMVLDALRDYLSAPIEDVCIHGIKRIIAHWSDY